MTSRARIIHSICRRSAVRCAFALLLAWVFAHTEAGAQNSWQFTNGAVECLAINAAGHIFAGTESGRVFRSTNNGDSWTSINTGLPSASDQRVSVYPLAINASGHIFAGTYVGVFRSMNNGDSWSDVNTGWPSYRVSVRSLTINASGHIFAGTLDDGVFRSMNNGGTWVPVNTGLKNAFDNSVSVYSLAINASGHIFVGTDGDGVFRSTDNGDTWRPINTGLPSTSDDGVSVQSLAINASGYIFAITNGDAVFRSTDNGDTWRPVNAGLPTFGIKCLAINPATQKIFVGTSTFEGIDAGVFRSTNNGDSWTKVNTGLTYPNVESLFINPTTQDIFAFTDGRRIFRSMNNGDSWTALNAGLINQPVRIKFPKSETAVTLHDHLVVGETKRYVLSALAGQTMRVIVSSSINIDLIVGQDGTVLKSQANYHNFWRGKLPATQDYFIDLTSESAKEGKDFDLSVLINPPGQATKWFTYRDEKAGFALRYSDYFVPDSRPKDYGIMKGETEFSLSFVGSEFFEGTNLRSVSFFVGTSEDEEIVSSCADSIHGLERAAGKEVINSVTYSKVEGGDAAAGSAGDWEIYRTIRRGTCYEVGFLFYYSNVMNYDPESGIRGFDHEGVLQKLHEVLSTFKFIKH